MAPSFGAASQKGVPDLLTNLRLKVGALLFDLPRYLVDVIWGGRWQAYRNRSDFVGFEQDPFSLRLAGRQTSSLHLCDQWPVLGRHLMKRALTEWPIDFAKEVQFSEEPVVSFIIPHRGGDRKSLLEMTIRSIAACTDVAIECLVVEQSLTQELGTLPGNTRIIHAPTRLAGDPWHKTYAYNVGAAAARGQFLVCHDGDVLVPRDYPFTLLRLMSERSLDVAFCQRFLFYLTRSATQSLLSESLSRLPTSISLVEIRQNWVGGTLGIRRDAYWDIGGFDEEFIGWTGEDTEFHDRCQLLSGWFHGFIPFVHLWHPPQTEKVGEARKAQAAFTIQKLEIPMAVRVERLKHTKAGRLPGA